MNTLETNIQRYLTYCKEQKRLDDKTLKAYRIDLTQFNQLVETNEITKLNVEVLEKYIASLHQTFKPKTVKRKIASAKAFFHYLEYKDIIQINPFHKMQIRFREPVILPKTIPLSTMEQLLITMYNSLENATSTYQRRKTLMDVTIVELLFSTGIRISELCKLKSSDIDFTTNTIIIFGKGSKERRLQIVNDNVCSIIARYYICYEKQIISTGYFFSSKSGEVLSDQYVRKMINKYSSLAGIAMHITPHMFRHTFATSLAKYFIDDLFVPNKKNTANKEFFRIFSLAKFSSLPKSEGDILKFERYQPIYEFYRSAPKDNSNLINDISRIIDLYSKQNNRLLANAYFVRGEIHRMYHEFDLAENDYMQSVMLTDDLNIKIQVYIIRYYLYNVKMIEKELDVEVPSLEKLAQMCRGKNHYGELLFNRINCIVLKDPNAKKIINHFDTRIMPIL